MSSSKRPATKSQERCMVHPQCLRRVAGTSLVHTQCLVNAEMGQVKSPKNHLSGLATNQDLALPVAKQPFLSAFLEIPDIECEHRELDMRGEQYGLRAASVPGLAFAFTGCPNRSISSVTRKPSCTFATHCQARSWGDILSSILPCHSLFVRTLSCCGNFL